MGRRDPDDGGDRIERRVRERIDRCLARRDAEGALEAMLSIPPAARSAILEPVVALLQASAPELQRQGAWGRLHVLAARAESEPRLLLPPPTAQTTGATSTPPSEPAQKARWVLLLACLHAKDWGRATRYLAQLRPVIDARAPALGGALAVWIERKGVLDAATLGPLQAAIPAPVTPDPRLGYEAPSRKRPSVPAPPVTTAEVEQQVIALAATHPFRTFAETVLAWQARAEAAVAAALACAAAPIAVREILLAMAGDVLPVEPAVLLGRLARSVPADDRLAAELQLGMRLALPRLTATPSPPRAPAAPLDQRTGSALQALAAGAARQVGAQGFVTEWLTASEPDPFTRAPWLRVAEGLLGGGDSLDRERRLRVWAASMSVWIDEHQGDDERPRLPSWLAAVTEKVVEHADALVAFLGSRETASRHALLAAVLAGASLPAATAILGACWDAADEERCRELAPMVAALMDRAYQETDDTDLMAELGDRSMIARLMRALEGDDGGMPPLIGPLRAVWRRVGERAARYDPELLAWALSESRSSREARRLIAVYREGRSGVDPLLEAMRAIARTEREDLGGLGAELATELLRSFSGDVGSLARALRWARTRGAPSRLVQEIAQALLAAAERLPPGASPPALAAELEVASRLAGRGGRRPRKRRSDSPPELSAKAKAPRKRRRQAPPPAEPMARTRGGKSASPSPGPAPADRGGKGGRGRAGVARAESAEPEVRAGRADPPPRARTVPQGAEAEAEASASDRGPLQLGLPLGDTAS